MKRYPVWTFAAVAYSVGCAILILSCSSFLHFKDPGAQAVTCAIVGPEMLIIESAAGICGPYAPACLSLLESIFGDACVAAAAAGKTQEEAHQAGLAAVNARASKSKAELVKAGVRQDP